MLAEGHLDDQQLGLLRDLADLVEAELAHPSDRQRKPAGMPAA